MITRLIAALAVITLMLTGVTACKTGSDLVLPNQTQGR